MKWYVRKYQGTENLGDVIQTFSLERLLPDRVEHILLSDSAPVDAPFLVNGWLGENRDQSMPTMPTGKVIFAGIHLQPGKESYFLNWIKKSGNAVGARDRHTLSFLHKHHINAEFSGCASLTLPPYAEARWGMERIDDESQGCKTNKIASSMSWEEQFAKATVLLDRIKKAEKVYSCRLHVVLPSLAMGTPVYYHDTNKPGFYGPNVAERFSIFEEMGCTRHDINGLSPIDIPKWSQTYKDFLRKVIGCDLMPGA